MQPLLAAQAPHDQGLTGQTLKLRLYAPPKPMADTKLMTIPGQVDPVPVARDITPREDGRIDLIGLPRPRIRELFEEAGLDARQAKLRSKQVFHWLYHRGVTDFEAMTDIAKTMRPWLTERFVMASYEMYNSNR